MQMLTVIFSDFCFNNYFIFLLEFTCCSRFFCFTEPKPMPCNDKTLTYTIHAKLKNVRKT